MLGYPYTSPQILTNSLYAEYGGETGTVSQGMLTAAYTVAEQQVSNYLHTFLVPTDITGTFTYYPHRNIVTDWAYVNSIHAVTLLTRQGNSTCTFTETDTCTYVRDDRYGILDVNLITNCTCRTGVAASLTGIYQIQIAYNAGLPSGTSYHPSVLLALTKQAEIVLNEMTHTLGGNESVGDAGVNSFANQDYREERVQLLRTGLGNSAIANFNAILLSHLRTPRRVGL